jgi:hypothetical protein
MKKLLIPGFIGLAVIIGLVFVFAKQPYRPPVAGPINQSSGNQTNSSSQPQLFESSPYKPYAYLISTDRIDASTQQALSGFKLEKQAIADGSQAITLKALDPGYADQSYAVKPGEKLYFIETTLGDDPDNHELSLSDDSAILVNAQGYIVNQ